MVESVIKIRRAIGVSRALTVCCEATTPPSGYYILFASELPSGGSRAISGVRLGEWFGAQVFRRGTL